VRSVRHAWLTEVIRQAPAASRGVYGARRVHTELTLGRGIAVGHGQVTVLMHRAGIKGLARPPRQQHHLIIDVTGIPFYSRRTAVR
jgi:transposase InsO family protein